MVAFQEGQAYILEFYLQSECLNLTTWLLCQLLFSLITLTNSLEEEPCHFNLIFTKYFIFHPFQVTIDGIVAAKFPHDDSWYRGRVCDFVSNEEDPQQSQVTVYYVDFGDTETIKMDTVCELRTDFLKLSFQAIECFLANINTE